MARYRGSVNKVARRFGEPIFGYNKYLDKKPYPPGQHGFSRKRKVQSEYGLQLSEKQKAKYTYGVLERQFRNVFKRANQSKGVTGEVLLGLLESRLDNTVFRLGLAPTRRAARQLVTHKHITVNGEIVSIPSATMRPGDVIGVKPKSQELEVIRHSVAARGKTYPWLEWDGDKLEGTYMQMPSREDIPENIQEQLIVELYSK